jgi:hypothetical protein
MADRDNKPKSAAASRQVHAAIDRIEDNEMAVLLLGDDGKTQLDVPVALLPEGVGDGDHLRITFSLDKASRDEAGGRVKKLQDKLAQKSGGQEQKDFKL